MTAITPELMSELKRHGLSVIPMKHAYRVNGCVDIWFDGYTLYDKPKNKYQYFNDSRVLISTAINMASVYGEHKPFKECKNGMSYQEFKLRVKDSYSAKYHWDNDKETSEKHLYFMLCGNNIKIGVSLNPSKRIKEIQTSSALPITILHIAENKGHMERVLHRSFSEWSTRKHGEWFVYSSPIEDFINYIKNP